MIILDGIGINPKIEGNAVALANTPNLDRLMSEYPNSTLITHSERVGLPEGQMGNSEVGHLNIGAGRVIEQWLVRINRELREKNFVNNTEWKEFLSKGKRIHLIGLVSDGGVHSSAEHLKSLLNIIPKDKELLIHAITDGRDTSPTSGLPLIKSLKLPDNAKLVSIIGRYYAMDRDTRWERTKIAYDAIVNKGNSKDLISAFQASYDGGVTDEFIKPIVAADYDGVKDGDLVLYWNYREDRMRQIVKVLSVGSFDFTPFKDRTLCFTDYDVTFNLPVLFHQKGIKNTLGEVISNVGLSQLRVAETEKYPHVTYFLNGGEEVPFKGEDRVLIPSPRDVPTYDKKPEMSAYEVTDAVIEGLKKYDLVVVNFANGDMVGHTGDLSAAIKAVETVDQCLGRILEQLGDREALIFADHGNCEVMIENGKPHTAHTTNPVPVILVTKEKLTLRDGGALCDIAPTVLKRMGIAVPNEMTGESLV